MMRLKVNKVRGGQHSSEVIVAIATADGGNEYVVVDERSVRDGSWRIGYPVGSDGDRVLVGLPRETTTGKWRVWVTREALIEEAAA